MVSPPLAKEKIRGREMLDCLAASDPIATGIPIDFPLMDVHYVSFPSSNFVFQTKMLLLAEY